MGQTLSTNEVYPLKGELPRVELPIAASQNLTLFEPVYLVNGQVTRWLAANSHGTASQPFFGWIGSVTTKTINGVTTSLPAGTLVSVIPAHKDVCWALPTYGQAPTVANIASGANTAGFQVFYDGSRYYVDLTPTPSHPARTRSGLFSARRRPTRASPRAAPPPDRAPPRAPEPETRSIGRELKIA